MIPASAVADSIGVDLHVNWPQYQNNQWQALVLDLGIKHTRGMLGHQSNAITLTKPLFDAGVKHCATIVQSAGGTLDRKAAQANFDFIANKLGAEHVTGLEGPNEFNHNHPANWATVERDFVHWMHDTVRANKALDSCNLVAPSIWGRVHADYVSLGSIDAFVDRGCLHYYTNTKKPTQSKASMDQSITDAHILTPKPLWVTEFGYDNNAVGDRLKAKYTIRGLFEFMRRPSVERVYLYELFDCTSGHQWGLVKSDMRTRRQAYFAVKNTLALYADTGTPVLKDLPISFSGAPSDMHSLIHQKSDGSYLVSLFRDVNSTEADMAPVNVNVQFQEVKSVVAYTPSIDSSPKQSVIGSSINVPLSDHLTVLKVSA